MKKLILVLILIIFVGQTFSQQKLNFYYRGDTVIVKTNNDCVFPGFTPGNHWPNNSATVWTSFSLAGTYYAKLEPMNRKSDFGFSGSSIVEHISSGPTPKNLNKQVTVDISIPDTMDLICRGEIWKNGNALITFKNYFVAREFPWYLVPESKYQVTKVKFSDLDSVQVIYVWSDNTGFASLTETKTAVEKALKNIGKIAPKFWHKYIQNFDGATYTLMVFIGNSMFGLEHTNSPFITAHTGKYSYMTESTAYHEVLHSLVGRSIDTKSYWLQNGSYETSGLLGFTEGLVNFMSLRYLPTNFDGMISTTISRSKLGYGCNNITTLPYCDQEFETYYFKGYMHWANLVVNGLDPDKWLNTVFENYLINNKWPMTTDFDDIFRWLSRYDKKIGKLAQKTYNGEYLTQMYDLLTKNGWSPTYLDQVPEWDDLYVGCFPIKEGWPMLPNDEFKTENVFIKNLFWQDKTISSETAANEIIAIAKNNKNSWLHLQLSNDKIVKTKDELRFLDNTPYFMHGKIELTEKNIQFWSKLNYYIK